MQGPYSFPSGGFVCHRITGSVAKSIGKTHRIPCASENVACPWKQSATKPQKSAKGSPIMPLNSEEFAVEQLHQALLRLTVIGGKTAINNLAQLHDFLSDPEQFDADERELSHLLQIVEHAMELCAN